MPVFVVALCAQLSTRSKLLRRSHFREQAGYKPMLQLGGPAVLCSERRCLFELATVLYRKDYSRFSRRGEREADSSNLKKGFGVTNFCWLPTSVGMFGYWSPFLPRIITTSWKWLWQDSTLFPEYYSVLQRHFRIFISVTSHVAESLGSLMASMGSLHATESSRSLRTPTTFPFLLQDFQDLLWSTMTSPIGYDYFYDLWLLHACSIVYTPGFGVTNFCWLPTSVGMFGYWSPFLPRIITTSWKWLWQDLTTSVIT